MKHIEKSEVGRQYLAAYEMQYESEDLREALVLYEGVITAFPESAEAGYSRSQINHIVRAVVPKQELFDAQVKLAHTHMKN
ncbi:MAG: hypothetical protein JXR76_00890 [Deltaproteobacteria bacterium]|nr:hypothetical protein [Deltaproteobacteria bacterium]